MNIFFLDPSPVICAEMHNNKHTVKMILEYAQLLSTAHRVLDGKETQGKSASGRNVKRWVLPDASRDTIMYAATHMNHPSAIWARKSDQNYIWLCNLLIALCEEYTYRYGKVHKVERDGLCFVLLKNIPSNIPKGAFTEPTPAMPDDVKIIGSSVKSYRNYYLKHKTHLASWKNRQTPKWFSDAIL